MKRIMRENTEQIQERREQLLSERVNNGNRLVEKWTGNKEVGKGLDSLFEKNANKARSLAFVLENQKNYLARLTETQISNTFTTAPNNIMKIVRYSYPNSVRGEIFTEWGMETARDSIFYLKAVYGSAKRGTTAGEYMLEEGDDRYASEIEEELPLETPNGSETTFTGITAGVVANFPLRPFSFRVLVDGVQVGVDDGAGNVVGTLLGTSTINYTTGEASVVFLTAPATGVVVKFAYNYDSEVSTQYTDLGSVELRLLDYLFRVKPYALGVSWSKMSEILLNTTLGIDSEEALVLAASDEIKKSLDFQACRLGYRTASGNTGLTFDANFANAGADSEIAHAMSVTKVFDNAGDLIFNDIQRGGVNKIYGGSKAMNFIKLHGRFDATGAQPKIGVHKIGSLDGIDLYKAPSSIVPTNEAVCVYKGLDGTNDSAISFGTLIPLYSTQKLERKEMYSEQGLAHFGDNKVTNSSYLRKITFSNLT